MGLSGVKPSEVKGKPSKADYMNNGYIPNDLIKSFRDVAVYDYTDAINWCERSGYQPIEGNVANPRHPFVNYYNPKNHTIATFVFENGGVYRSRSIRYVDQVADASIPSGKKFVTKYKADFSADDLQVVAARSGNGSAQPVQSAQAGRNNAGRVTVSNMGHRQPYAFEEANLPRLQLRDGTAVDFNSPEIKNRIAQMRRDGKPFTIGRGGDSEIKPDVPLNGVNNSISRKHISVSLNKNGQIVIEDISAGGGTLMITPEG
jgi:hypothetical protein